MLLRQNIKKQQRNGWAKPDKLADRSLFYKDGRRNALSAVEEDININAYQAELANSRRINRRRISVSRTHLESETILESVAGHGKKYLQAIAADTGTEIEHCTDTDHQMRVLCENQWIHGYGAIQCRSVDFGFQSDR